MPQLHTYAVDLTWTGARTYGTTSFTAYGRDHELRAGDRPVLLGTSDPHFRDGSPVTDEVLSGLHAEAHEHCFIARSMNFPVRVQPAPLTFVAPPA